MTSGRSAYLAEALAILWPAPAPAVGPEDGTRGGGGGAAKFVILPTARRPALLVPRRPHAATAAAVRSYKAAAQRPDWLLLRAAAIAARAGLADLLAGQVSIDAAGWAGGITGYLRAALGRDLLVSLYVTRPKANRKPVLQLLTADGQVLGFCKVGIGPLTCGLVRAEAAALAKLGGRSLALVCVPRLLHHGQWLGHDVVVQQALAPAGRAESARAGRQAALAAAMAELATAWQVERRQVAGSDYWLRLRASLAAIAERDQPGHAGRSAGQLALALDQLAPLAGATCAAFGAWHGDWTPWNMAWSAGRALVWDWERFDTGIPVGFDALHYRLHDEILRKRRDPAAAAAALLAGAGAILAPLGVPAGAADLVAAMYVAEIAARYLRDGQAEAGVSLGRVDGWLIPALTAHSLRLSQRSLR